MRLHQQLDAVGFYVTVAETLGKREKAVHTLLWGFGVAMLLVLSAIGLASRWAIQRGLSPLSTLERDLSRRSVQDLSPVDPSTVPVEIRQLVAALNTLFAGLESAGHQQRRFLQEAAHQLRTLPRAFSFNLSCSRLRPTMRVCEPRFTTRYSG